MAVLSKASAKKILPLLKFAGGCIVIATTVSKFPFKVS
jgi:hypothetical protein